MSITHPEMVAKLVKPGDQIAAEMTKKDLQTLTGYCAQLILAGYSLDSVKKRIIYRQNNQDTGRKQAEIEGTQAHLLHMAVGIAGEAAELLDAVVKYVEGDRLDIDNCIEELGDIEFYMEGFRDALSFTRKNILDANIEKLSVRYDGLNYSDQAAQDRADKQ